MSDLAASYQAKLAAPRLQSMRMGWSMRSPQVLVGAFVVAIGFLVCYPVVMLLLGSFAPPRGVTNVWFSLDGYRTALLDDDARRAIFTTLWLAVVRATLGVSLAIFLSWAVTRTNIPGKRVFHNLLILNFFLPLLPQVVAWSLLLSPKSGIVNVWLRGLLGSDSGSGPFNIYSYGGIIFLGSLGWAGFLYLLLSPAFQAMDAALEEAARTSGASSWRTVLRITVPILLPAVLGCFSLAFVRMVESFEIELLLGTPAHIYVFTTQIYYYIHQQQLPNYPPAIALSTVLIVLTLAVIAIQSKLLGKRSYVTVSGKSYRRTPVDLGPWKWLVFAILLAFFFIHLAVPLFMLVVGSLQRTTIDFRMDAFTFDHWKILRDADVWQSLKNTLVVGLVASTVGMLLVSLCSYIVTRTKLPLRRPLDIFTWVPYMVPSFVLSVGFLWAVLKGIPLPFTLYGTLALLMIAFVVRLLPFGARLMNGTMVQLSSELEESARTLGASWVQSMRKIVLPLLSPSLAIGWLLCMITVIRDLSTIILLYGAKSKMLAITFYSYWTSGAIEDAAVIGLFMAMVGLILVGGIRLLQRHLNVSQQAVI
ncbi:MAG TPA: iron ABC transporter permease [Chloroflexota bacterium]|nr:iron ABC transporter permease [Chloroflexota bacterium]